MAYAVVVAHDHEVARNGVTHLDLAVVAPLFAVDHAVGGVVAVLGRSFARVVAVAARPRAVLRLCGLRGEFISLCVCFVCRINPLHISVMYNRQKIFCLFVRFLRSFRLKFGRHVELGEISNFNESCIAKF